MKLKSIACATLSTACLISFAYAAPVNTLPKLGQPISTEKALARGYILPNPSLAAANITKPKKTAAETNETDSTFLRIDNNNNNVTVGTIPFNGDTGIIRTLLSTKNGKVFGSNQNYDHDTPPKAVIYNAESNSWQTILTGNSTPDTYIPMAAVDPDSAGYNLILGISNNFYASSATSIYHFANNQLTGPIPMPQYNQQNVGSYAPICPQSGSHCFVVAQYSSHELGLLSFDASTNTFNNTVQPLFAFNSTLIGSFYHDGEIGYIYTDPNNSNANKISIYQWGAAQPTTYSFPAVQGSESTGTQMIYDISKGPNLAFINPLVYPTALYTSSDNGQTWKTTTLQSPGHKLQNLGYIHYDILTQGDYAIAGIFGTTGASQAEYFNRTEATPTIEKIDFSAVFPSQNVTGFFAGGDYSTDASNLVWFKGVDSSGQDLYHAYNLAAHGWTGQTLTPPPSTTPYGNKQIVNVAQDRFIATDGKHVYYYDGSTWTTEPENQTNFGSQVFLIDVGNYTWALGENTFI